jgi:hypothetical protein
MKSPKPFILMFLLITALSKALFAQNAGTVSNSNVSQLKIMVIPYAKNGEDLRTKLASNTNLRDVIAKIKDEFDKKGFSVQDFEATLKDAGDKQIFKSTAQPDIKNTFITYSGVDIYVEVEISILTTGKGTTAKVLLNAYDASASGNVLTSITCNSRERYNTDIATLVNVAVSIPVPPMNFTDDDNRSKLPCLDDFMNALQAKLTGPVIEKFVATRKARQDVANQQNCQLFMARAGHELLQHHYDEARNILSTISQENGTCFTEVQQKIEDLFKQQYGSLDKASVYYQKEVIINPESELYRKNLNIVNKFIETRNEQDKTPPEIILETPKGVNGKDLQADVTSKGEIYVSGFVKDDSGVGLVTVNGKAVTNLQPGGFFSIYVDKNASDIKINASDKKGNGASKTFHIASKTDDNDLSAQAILPITDDEKFHAIFIANSNYSGGKWNALKSTVVEARNLMKLFIAKYGFDAANVDTLFNKSRTEILTVLTDKLKKLTENDNLVIFYGGHGYYNAAQNLAYWVPLNTSSEFDYISNLQITSLLAGCNARHILIMADACFSGAMRGGVDAPSRNEYKVDSRQLLTSGGTEMVPTTSVYVKELLKNLESNPDKYVSARDLQSRIYPGIKNEAQTECTLITLQVSDSAGGQFYFKKN